MKTKLATATVLAAILLAAGGAWADWDPEDPYKMHYPQLPDPNGWDVGGTAVMDDFQCTQTGPITDVHFWVSWKGDDTAWSAINNIEVWLSSDIPDPDGEGPLYSMPGDFLWNYNTFTDGFDYRYAGAGDQGWYTPTPPEVLPSDHVNYYQVNVHIPEDWPSGQFEQSAGTIYWLGIYFYLEDGVDEQIGWKTSLDSWNDTAVWASGAPTVWHELRIQGDRDMAFVIVPEPATMSLLALGGAALLRRRRKRTS